MHLLLKEQEAMRTRAAALILKRKEHEQREKDLTQMQRHRRLFFLELTNIFESFPFIFFVFILALSLGAIAGLNIPDVVGCSDKNTMCSYFRFRQPKVEYK